MTVSNIQYLRMANAKAVFTNIFGKPVILLFNTDARYFSHPFLKKIKYNLFSVECPLLPISHISEQK